jgi:hypothetical protein
MEKSDERNVAHRGSWMISYIVSVYDRPLFLTACLGSLGVQSFQTETIVCANHVDENMLMACGLCCMDADVRIEHTGIAGAKNCYESASMVAPNAKADWLCFPSDDSLYVCQFSGIMLETAAKTGADLVYCDCVYRQDETAGRWPAYKVLTTEPRMGKIDKTCFILRRELFNGFPPHPKGWSDGALIEQLVRDGVRHAKAPGVLVVHQ